MLRFQVNVYCQVVCEEVMWLLTFPTFYLLKGEKYIQSRCYMVKSGCIVIDLCFTKCIIFNKFYW